MGNCPCPRCKTPLSKVHLVGTKGDRRRRLGLQRSDDHRRQLLVSTARKAIYEENYGVSSARVERLLQAESLVPTTVILLPFLHRLQRSTWPRSECIFRSTLKTWARYLLVVSSGLDA
jgi:hypothetical protein